jgi:hypothetical protein
MDDKTGLLIAIVLGVLLVAALMTFIIPEPGERAVIATERLDLAVLKFNNSSSWDGIEETLRARVETKLVNTQGITVFSRTRLDELLTEQVLGESGFIDPATAARIGSLTGVSKLITGTVYGIDTRAEEITVCEEWKDGNCVRSVPATRHTVKVLSQIEVLNAASGQIEQARDVTGSASTTVKEGEVFSGYDALIARGADDIASDVASLLTSTYTREFRYGLYRDYKTKREGYVGIDETTRFDRADETAKLIVHFTRIRKDDLFELVWTDPQGMDIETTEDIVSSGDWRLYTLNLSSPLSGRFTVRGILNGTKAFEKTFMLRD